MPPQAEAVLGAKADAMASLRSGGEEGVARYNAALKAARWQTWVMNVQVGGGGPLGMTMHGAAAGFEME
jgi:hypothetical protein